MTRLHATASGHAKLRRLVASTAKFYSDTAELTGEIVQLLVSTGCAAVTDPRLAEEASIIDKAAALGLPQKIRELAAFALPKKDRWSVRPKDSETNE